MLPVPSTSRALMSCRFIDIGLAGCGNIAIVDEERRAATSDKYEAVKQVCVSSNHKHKEMEYNQMPRFIAVPRSRPSPCSISLFNLRLSSLDVLYLFAMKIYIPVLLQQAHPKHMGSWTSAKCRMYNVLLCYPSFLAISAS